MPTTEQLEALADITADGKRVTLIPPRGGVTFVSGGSGSNSPLPNIETWMLPLQYGFNKIDNGSILTGDSRMMLGAAAFPGDLVPGPNWFALVRTLADNDDFPSEGEAGVRRFTVVRLDDVTYDDGGGGAPLLYYLQVRT